MEKRKVAQRSAIALAGAVLLACATASCTTLKLPQVGKRGDGKIPGAGDGFLAAKVVAFRHAMEQMPTDAKRYGNEFYVASGIHDLNPQHANVLVAELQDQFPPVVDASQMYTRGENSKWMVGKPALVWTSTVAGLNEDRNVVLIVGWMHSNLLYEFYSYELRFRAKEGAWEILDYQVVDDPRRG